MPRISFARRYPLSLFGPYSKKIHCFGPLIGNPLICHWPLREALCTRLGNRCKKLQQRREILSILPPFGTLRMHRTWRMIWNKSSCSPKSNHTLGCSPALKGAAADTRTAILLEISACDCFLECLKCWLAFCKKNYSGYFKSKCVPVLNYVLNSPHYS